jgi:hypothetical protein
MDTALFLRALFVWFIIASAETVHGILRFKFLNPLVGDKRARQLAIISGSLLILVLTTVFIRFLAPLDAVACHQIGALWVLLMISFDLALGRILMRASWKRLMADFNPLQGGFLGFGMVVLFFAPTLAIALRNRL